jgi:hypothetical protein
MTGRTKAVAGDNHGGGDDNYPRRDEENGAVNGVEQPGDDRQK